MTERSALQSQFLADAGWRDAHIQPLAGDASLRRFFRLTHPRWGSAMLMDAPPETGEDCRPFVAVNRWLEAQALSAPAILHDNLAQGFVLLEDLGDGLFAQLMAREGPQTERTLYEAAIHVLVELHDIDAPVSLALDCAEDWPLRPYNHDALLTETALLPDWFFARQTGTTFPADLKAEFDALWRTLTPHAMAARPVFVHRDYHAENLLWMPERTGVQKVGLIDHQDALAGHPAYDLISLIEDARRTVTPAMAAHLTTLYCNERRARDLQFDEEAFRLAMAVLAAQRNTKIIGIFARLAMRDSKPKYLALIPHVWSMLERDLSHPALADLKTFIDTHFPPDLRTPK